MTRAAVLRDPAISRGGWPVRPQSSLWRRYWEYTSRPVDVRDAARSSAPSLRLRRGPNGGLIVPRTGLQAAHRDLIIALAARHRCRRSTPIAYLVASGGLMSYGAEPDRPVSAKPAGYVDRILKGEKPADLPVQAADQVRAGDQPQDRQGARPRQCRRRCLPAPTR